MESVISEKLDYFVEKFVLKFENRFSDYIERIDKFFRSEEASQVINIGAAVAYGITLRNAGEASSGITNAFGTIIASKNQIRQQIKNLLDKLYLFKKDGAVVRRNLVEAAYKIFCSFEFQFTAVAVDGSWERAITKLSEDAVGRSIHYFLTNPKVEFSTESICRGVILGESPKFTSLLRSGRTVYYKNTVWNTSQIFSKVGLTDKTHFYSKRNGKADTFKYGYRLPLEHDDLEECLEETPKFVYTYVLNPTDENENIQRLLNNINEKYPIFDASRATTSNNAETIIKQVKSDITKTLDDVEEQKKEFILKSVECINKDLKEKLKCITEHENKLVIIEETLKNEKIHVETKFVEMYSFMENEFKALKGNVESFKNDTDQKIINIEQQFQQIHINMKQEKEDNEKRCASLNSLIESCFMKMHKHMEAYHKEKMDKLDYLLQNIQTMQGNGNNFT